MVDVVDSFKVALDRVPPVLLSRDDARVLTDGRTSADVLDSLLSSPTSIVFVGSTGVGKSHLVNRVAGMSVSAVGELRPTTTTVTTAGSSGPATIGCAREYVYVQSMQPGVAVVDTPPWETDRVVVDLVLSHADVGVLVVSPSRYADAASAELWRALASVPGRIVVLNRLRGTGSEMAEVLSSVRNRFSEADVLVFDEMGEREDLLEEILEKALDRRSRESKVAIARAAAAEAGRYLARAVTTASVDLGRVKAVVDAVAAPESTGRNLAVRETWYETERDLVGSVEDSVNELDRSIVELADTVVAERVRTSLKAWESSAVEDALRDWQAEVMARFRSGATIRWRRNSTDQMIDREAWKAAVNPAVQLPKRVRRVMRSNLEPVTMQSHDLLVSILANAMERRIDEWRAPISEISSFKPGELLAASQELEVQ